MRLAIALLLAASVWGGEQVAAVDSIGLTVADLDRAVDFYTKVLTFEKTSENESTGAFGARIRQARLKLGDEQIELVEFASPRGRTAPEDSRSNDRWFQHIAIIVRDMDAAYASLRSFNVRHVSTAPQKLPEWNKNAGGIKAFYFQDPDGHPLEVLWFPAGKGDAKWQRPTERLFLGIDHTAIVVADTEASLRFYRDRLGMRVAGASENYGPEQERLNSVFGARLRITALRAAAGPGIELLEYVSPAGGRPYPRDVQPNDLVYWQTRLLSQSVYAPVLGTDTGARPGSHKSVITRDPDGHAIEIAGR